MPTPTYTKSNHDESELAKIEDYKTQFKVFEDSASQIKSLISNIIQSVGQRADDDLKISLIKKSFTDKIIDIKQIKTAIELIDDLSEIVFMPKILWDELDRDGRGGLSQDRWEWIRKHKAELVEFGKLNTLITHIKILGGGLRNIVTKELNRERAENHETNFEGNRQNAGVTFNREFYR